MLWCGVLCCAVLCCASVLLRIQFVWLDLGWSIIDWFSLVVSCLVFVGLGLLCWTYLFSWFLSYPCIVHCSFIGTKRAQCVALCDYSVSSSHDHVSRRWPGKRRGRWNTPAVPNPSIATSSLRERTEWQRWPHRSPHRYLFFFTIHELLVLGTCLSSLLPSTVCRCHTHPDFWL